ncbi:MAG: anti-sigma factor [Chloroflexota bacterium]|nr:anti-sigma factor [Chloroflexota bacterium]
MNGHPTDDLAAYAIGALDGPEQRAVAAHVDTCPICRAEARSFAETTWAIAETAERDVPPRLRGAIVERALQPARASSLREMLRVLWRPVPIAVPLALAAVLLFAMAGYATARRDADRYAATIASVAGARVVTLAATGAASTGMRASLVVPADGATPFLVLDLPAPAAGKTWEAWVIHGDVAARAGITDDRGATTLQLGAPLAPGDTVAITAEAQGGVDRPTSGPVLAGSS